MKKVLVTGAAGFIACETARQLLAQGIQVVALDNMNDYYDVRLKEHRLQALSRMPGFEFHKIDIEDQSALAKLFAKHKFDVVFNLAARAGVRYSLINPTVYFTTNTLGTLNILDLMLKHKISKMVLASTSSLYAGEKLPFNEEAPVNSPISPYAASKKAAEQLCYTYNYHYEVDCTVVRYFTVYGPAGRPDMSIYRFIYWIDQGHPLELFGDGNQSRDFTYVEDIAAGTILAAKPLGYEVVNLGGGRAPVTLNQIIGQIESALGKKAKINRQPVQKADIAETQADIAKAKRLLGWTPKIGVDDGLNRTIEWYKANREFVAQLRLD